MYGDLENILAHAAEVKKRPREALLAMEDMARLSKQLVTIRCDVDIPLDPAALRVNAPDVQALRHLYLELEFNSMLRDLGGAGENAATDSSAANDSTGAKSSSSTSAPSVGSGKPDAGGA